MQRDSTPQPIDLTIFTRNEWSALEALVSKKRTSELAWQEKHKNSLVGDFKFWDSIYQRMRVILGRM